MLLRRSGLLRVRCVADDVSRARGMRDELPHAAERSRLVIETARRVVSARGFREVRTPVLEKRQLFERGLGAESDAVSKELYVVEGDAGLALRPENTAGVVRALVEGDSEREDGESEAEHAERRASVALPVRWYYEGDMFRRERPQRGRWRQFRQFGVEMFTGATFVERLCADLEILSTALAVLRELVGNAELELQINTLGDAASRAAYSAALREHFSRNRDALSEHSKMRLDRGAPLRILDSKEACDEPILQQAPDVTRYLSPDSAQYWIALQQGLRGLGVPYVHNARLVRGLDYYEDTVFEFVLRSNLLGASQATVLAGGRYDSLVQRTRAALHGVSASTSSLVGAAGWSLGVERCALVVPSVNAHSASSRVACVVTTSALDTSQSWRAVRCVEMLSKSGWHAQLLAGRAWAKLVRKANDRGAAIVVFVGPDEVASDSVKIKLMQSGREMVISMAQLESELKSMHV